jgi:8-oxo-dGTP pyrophosphatase MutT (NUDIX family)
MSITTKLSVSSVIYTSYLTDDEQEVIKFLMVVENIDGELIYNQPSGHLELSEQPHEGAKREVLEETGYTVNLKEFLGTYIMMNKDLSKSYTRLCYYGELDDSIDKIETCDEDIVSIKWLTRSQIAKLDEQGRTRNKAVLQCVDDFLKIKNHYRINQISFMSKVLF